jgi:hypothetical protein
MSEELAAPVEQGINTSSADLNRQAQALKDPGATAISRSASDERLANAMASLGIGSLDQIQDLGEVPIEFRDGGGETPPREAPAAEAAPPPLAPTTAPAEPPAPAPGLPTAEERKAYIAKLGEASKAERAARQRQKLAEEAEHRAAETAARAEAFQKATGSWQQNPESVLLAAGIDPAAYFKRYSDYLANPTAPPPVDPVEAKVEERLQPYIKQQQEFLEQQQRQALAWQEAGAVASKVLPAISTEKHEVLLAIHGGDANRAAAFVYQKMKEYHQETGKFIPPADAAADLEDQFYAQQVEALRAAKALKKLSSEFGVAPAPTAPAPAPAPVAKAATPAAAAPPAAPALSSKVVIQSPVRGTGAKTQVIHQHRSGRDGELDSFLKRLGI